MLFTGFAKAFAPIAGDGAENVAFRHNAVGCPGLAARNEERAHLAAHEQGESLANAHGWAGEYRRF